jgi:hypothetical protein
MAAVEALNKLAKWRSVFAGWQLGTRSEDDAECKAVRDHREVTIVLRAEVNAITGLLIEKGVFTVEEWDARLEDEANHLSAEYSQRFPGFEATEHGMAMDLAKVRGTMRGWLP